MSFKSAAGYTALGVLSPVAALGTYLWKSSQDHPYADKFREQYQDPFGKAVAAVIDPITRARQEKTLTYEQASKAQTDLEALIGKFQEDANAYAAQGRSQNNVVEGAFRTFNEARADLNGQSIWAAWRNPIAEDLKSLAPKFGDGTGGDVPNMTTMLKKLKTTPAAESAKAANFVLRQLQGGGMKQIDLGGSAYSAITRRAASLRGM
jgi:hypothetical protein